VLWWHAVGQASQPLCWRTRLPGRPATAALGRACQLTYSEPPPTSSDRPAVGARRRNFDDKLDILEQEGLPTSAEFMLRADAAPSSQMLAFLRLMQLGAMDAFLLESIFRCA
jgi:hypothetical protein